MALKKSGQSQLSVIIKQKILQSFENLEGLSLKSNVYYLIYNGISITSTFDFLFVFRSIPDSICSMHNPSR